MNKLVIITGGSRGLGMAISSHLLKQGYSVAAFARTATEQTQNLSEKYGTLYFFEEVDIRSGPERDGFFQNIRSRFSDTPLYALINNAGIAKEGILATFPSVDTQSVIDINLTSAIEMSRSFIRAKLLENSPGRLINISSIIGQRGYTGLGAYSASKAGLEGVTRSLARELGRREITVNCIAPGYLTTEMTSTLSNAKQKQIIDRTPLKRLGSSDDICPAVDFLLDERNAFFTGQTLTIDGGITC